MAPPPSDTLPGFLSSFSSPLSHSVRVIYTHGNERGEERQVEPELRVRTLQTERPLSPSASSAKLEEKNCV